MFNATEINSSFRNEHRQSTYERWAASVPASFRFSVKLSQVITHERRLVRVHSVLPPFLDAINALGTKLGALLMQLPPSFEFAPRVAGRFFDRLRKRHAGPVVLEPRHATWFSADAVQILHEYAIGKVAADPPPVESAAIAATWDDATYFRLHGSPCIYYSPYSDTSIKYLAATLTAKSASRTRPVWCIFDNTASGAAAGNALSLVTNLAKTKGSQTIARNKKGGVRPLS